MLIGDIYVNDDDYDTSTSQPCCSNQFSFNQIYADDHDHGGNNKNKNQHTKY